MTKKKQNEDQLSLAGTEEGEILAKLSERVEKAVQTIQELRRERDLLKTRLAAAESGASEKVSALEEEHEKFSRERTEIRNRIENILGTLEALDTAE